MYDRIIKFLDKEFSDGIFRDSSNNGLQVANSGRLGRICCGVDASLEFMQAAKKQGASLLIVHHGLSWGDSLKKITGLNYKRVKYLMDNDLALYACHLPLDAHPKYGNNVQICKMLGIRGLKKFGHYGGGYIGFGGSLPRELTMQEFKTLIASKISPKITAMEYGKKKVKTVAVVSGGASEELEQAAEQGYDVFLSGEYKLLAYINARDIGMNAVFAGHYATEIFGVKTIAALLKAKFKVDSLFLDLEVVY